MCDGLPRIILFIISLSTNFVQGSPEFPITNLTVKILTNGHNLFGNPLSLTHLCDTKMHSRPDQSMTHMCTVSVSLSWAKFLFEVFIFLSTYQRSCQCGWIVGEDDIDFNQTFHSLIIKSFHNQIRGRLWSYLDYHDSVILPKTIVKGLIMIIKSNLSLNKSTLIGTFGRFVTLGSHGWGLITMTEPLPGWFI